jgi:hypothetical protein
MNLVFSSKAPQKSRAALEELFYFNPLQHRVRAGIINSLEHFGHPRLEESTGGISICVGEHTPQTLFAFDRDTSGGDPVGVVVFMRTSSADMAIMHIAVHPDYTLKKSTSDVGLGAVLIEKVREIAARIVGVQRIIFFYRKEVVIRV